MKQHHKLSQEQQQQAETQSHQNLAAKSQMEFDNPEMLLRHDAAQVPVPPAIAHRLRESSADLEQPRASWWQRWFKK